MAQPHLPIIVHLRGEQSGGQLALIELVVAAGAAGRRCTSTPAGFERYFDRLAEGTGGDPPPDQAIAVGSPIGG